MSRTVLVVSHPATVALNQLPYVALLDHDIDVQVVVPHRWRHELGGGAVPPEVHPQLAGRVHPARIIGVGKIQRHVYRDLPGRWLRRFRPDAVLVEAEHLSLPAAQWTAACRLRRIPVAVTGYENLDRPLPWPARLLRAATLRSASGVFARTPTAARRAEQWGARGPVHVVPPAVDVPTHPAAPAPPEPFTVGFAGRLIDAKGIGDLVAAVERLGPGARLLAVGDGPWRSRLEQHPAVEVRTGVTHAQMGSAYADMHVLVLPSHTTATWAEQLGRVLLEAAAAGRPIIGADSGEIPWVLEVVRGGRTFPEGDVAALTTLLASVRDDPQQWAQLAAQGRQQVIERFSPAASARGLVGLLDEMDQ